MSETSSYKYHGMIWSKLFIVALVEQKMEYWLYTRGSGALAMTHHSIYVFCLICLYFNQPRQKLPLLHCTNHSVPNSHFEAHQEEAPINLISYNDICGILANKNKHKYIYIYIYRQKHTEKRIYIFSRFSIYIFIAT